MKAVLVFLTILAASFNRQQVYAQAAMQTAMPTSTDYAATAKSSMSFQSAAFPIGTTGKVKVIFEDPTSKGASIVIRNKNGSIVYSKNYKNKGSHKSNIDLSPLTDGAYTVEVISLTKAGFNKERYVYNFQLQSTTTRNLTSINKELEKKLFTPRHYQVRR
jgi:hypothetical protein